jgi:ankyrin repeat/BTB/POZ domain-containing protein 1
MSTPRFVRTVDRLLTRDSIRYYLSERFRLRFEDSGLEDLMDENGELHAEAAQAISNVSSATDEGIDMKPAQAELAKTETTPVDPPSNPFMNGEIRTLDGDIAGDEFAADAINYQVLLGKIDSLLERLKLDA